MSEHKFAHILRALADGKEIQWKNPASSNVWKTGGADHYLVAGADHLEWRIKPEKKSDGQLLFEIVNGACRWHKLSLTSKEFWEQKADAFLDARIAQNGSD